MDVTALSARIEASNAPGTSPHAAMAAKLMIAQAAAVIRTWRAYGIRAARG
jgi:hypothetical protein